MKIRGKAIWAVLALIVSFGLLFSCTKEKEPYKVGAVFSVTGRASFLGEPEKKTAEMIAEAININSSLIPAPKSLASPPS